MVDCLGDASGWVRGTAFRLLMEGKQGHRGLTELLMAKALEGPPLARFCDRACHRLRRRWRQRVPSNWGTARILLGGHRGDCRGDRRRCRRARRRPQVLSRNRRHTGARPGPPAHPDSERGTGESSTMGGNPEMISASRGIPGDLSQAARWAETIVIVTALATVPDASGRTVAALSNGSRRFPTGHNPSDGG